MTKEEVLKTIQNHAGDVRTVLIGLESRVKLVVKGVYAEPESFISDLKVSLDAAKGQIEEIKDVLDQWPE